MGRAAAHAATVSMARVMEVAVLIPTSKAPKVIRAVLIKVIRVVISAILPGRLAAVAIWISE